MPFYASYPIFRFDGSEDEDAALSERKQQAARECRFEEWLSSTPELKAPLVSCDLTTDEEHIVNNSFDFNKWEEDCYCVRSGASSSHVIVDALVTRESRTGEKRKREESGDEDCTSRTLDCSTRRIRTSPQSHLRNRDYLEYTCSWKLDGDAGICGFSGKSHDMWRHIRAIHGVPALVEPAADQVRCNWDGCEATMTPSDMDKHWETTHEAGLDAQSGMVRCKACPSGDNPVAWMKTGSIIRHLRQIHWKAKVFCDGCGGTFRPDVFNTPRRDHRGTCLNRLMQRDPRFLTQ